jgi:hypothetical protein
LANSSDTQQLDYSVSSHAAQTIQHLPPLTDTDTELSFPPNPSPSSPLPISPKTSLTDQSIPSDSTVSTNGESKWTFPFRRSSNNAPKQASRDSDLKAKSKPVFQSFCFSADGKTLILWNKSKDHVYTSVIPARDGPESFEMWDWKKFFVPCATLVAGGRARVAAISKVFKLMRMTMKNLR